MSISPQIFKKLLNADLATLMDLYCNPLLYNCVENTKTCFSSVRKGLIPFELQKSTHCVIYVLYCFFVLSRLDCKMRSLAPFGMPLFLSSRLIYRKHPGSFFLTDILSPDCVEDKDFVLFFEPGSIVCVSVGEGLATNFGSSKWELPALLLSRPPEFSAEFFRSS